MVDFNPETGMTGGGLVLLWRVLGPAAGELGEALRRWTADRVHNVERITQIAADRSGSALELEGFVHPRVAHQIIENGSWVDDAVMQEYLGGLLAAARTPDGTDDRAAYYVNAVAAMSGNAIRVHYDAYRALVGFPQGTDTLMTPDGLADLMVAAPLVDCGHLVGSDEPEITALRLDETYWQLKREGLTSGGGIASAPHLPFQQKHIAIVPSDFGIRLFMAAHGVIDRSWAIIFDEPQEFGRPESFPVMPKTPFTVVGDVYNDDYE